MYIQRLYPGETIVVQYMDDILVLGPPLHRVRAKTQQPVQIFKQHNWVISAKSELEPSHHVTWMGKQFDGAEGSVSSDPVYIFGIIMLWLTLATRGYRHKHLHRLLGKLQWALRPGRGAAPFLAGPYAWLHQGPDTSKCTPTLVLCRGQHSVSLHGVGPDLLHTCHCTPCLLMSSLVCGPGEWRANWGASMFKSDSTRIPSSVALRCG